VQILWSFISIASVPFSGAGLFTALGLVMRFNELGKSALIDAHLDELIINRLAYAVIGIALMICSIAIYNYKRKGRLDLPGVIKRRVKR
jgi:hypothetical protein